MWQVVVLRIHSHAGLEGSCSCCLDVGLEGVEVSFLAGHLERVFVVYVLFTVLVGADYDNFQAYSVVESLFVDDVFHVVSLACHHSCCRYGSIFRHYVDGVPALGYCFLPLCYFLGELVVVGCQLVEAFCLSAVELAVVVVELSFHRVVWCDLCDGVLDDLHPAFAVVLLALVVVERYDFVLEQSVDCCCVELVLIALVLVGAFFGECPSCSFAVAFEPPSVEHGKVYHAVHLCFFARCS